MLTDDTHTERLNRFLKNTGRQIRDKLLSSQFVARLPDGPIKHHILDYSLRGGKHLRPGLVCAAAGAVGGDPISALPVAIAIEMTHTWTLVHDDIIDRDKYRRGGLTIHAQIHQDLSISDQLSANIPSEHLAHSLALLVGDTQHCFVMELMTEAGLTGSIPSALILHLIADLEGHVLPTLLTGEVSDVLQTTVRLDAISLDEIELMLQRKTGMLLMFSVRAGGLVGLSRYCQDHPWIQNLSAYGRNLGLAFQLQDDILGILGNENILGKPVGSDFREGKRTLAVKYAYDQSPPSAKQEIECLLGKPELTEMEIERLRNIVIDGDGVAFSQSKSRQLIQQAVESLHQIPHSEYRDLLESVAIFSISRQF